MTTKAGGTGDALNATVSTEAPEGTEADEEERHAAAVEAAKAKVERQKEHLAAAEAALAELEG